MIMVWKYKSWFIGVHIAIAIILMLQSSQYISIHILFSTSLVLSIGSTSVPCFIHFTKSFISAPYWPRLRAETRTTQEVRSNHLLQEPEAMLSVKFLSLSLVIWGFLRIEINQPILGYPYDKKPPYSAFYGVRVLAFYGF